MRAKLKSCISCNGIWQITVAFENVTFQSKQQNTDGKNWANDRDSKLQPMYMLRFYWKCLIHICWTQFCTDEEKKQIYLFCHFLLVKLLDQFRYWSRSHFRCCTFSTMQIFIVCSDYLFHWIDVLSKYVLFNNSSSVAPSLTFFIIRFWVTALLTQTQMTFLPCTFVAHWIFIYKWDKQLKPSQFYKKCFDLVWHELEINKKVMVTVSGGAFFFFFYVFYVRRGTTSKAEYITNIHREHQWMFN